MTQPGPPQPPVWGPPPDTIAQPPQAAHRRPPIHQRRWFWPVAAGLAGLFVGTGIGSTNSTTQTVAGPERTVQVPGPTLTVDRTVTVTVTPSPAAKPKPPPAPAQVAFPGDGTFLVGEDLKAGTYRSGAPESGSCYWARLRNASGNPDDIIANNISAGPSVVTIRPTDVAFKTSRCEQWVKVG